MLVRTGSRKQYIPLSQKTLQLLTRYPEKTRNGTMGDVVIIQDRGVRRTFDWRTFLTGERHVTAQ